MDDLRGLNWSKSKNWTIMYVPNGVFRQPTCKLLKFQFDTFWTAHFFHPGPFILARTGDFRPSTLAQMTVHFGSRPSTLAQNHPLWFKTVHCWIDRPLSLDLHFGPDEIIIEFGNDDEDLSFRRVCIRLRIIFQSHEF